VNRPAFGMETNTLSLVLTKSLKKTGNTLR
jgi:hypothetical protein